MSSPLPLPPRRRSSRPVEKSTGPARISETEILALQSQANLIELVRDLVRRVEKLENRTSRVYTEGG